MKTLEYVKTHIAEFEEDNVLDSRFTKRLVDFLPTEEWEQFGFKYSGDTPYTPKEWTEENVLAQLKADVEFGYEKSIFERGISSSLMASVVRGWCKVLENGCVLPEDDDGWYHIDQFKTVAKHYGWRLEGER